MTDANPAVERLRQLLALLAREEFQLLGVRERLFGKLPDGRAAESILPIPALASASLNHTL